MPIPDLSTLQKYRSSISNHFAEHTQEENRTSFLQECDGTTALPIVFAWLPSSYIGKLS